MMLQYIKGNNDVWLGGINKIIDIHQHTVIFIHEMCKSFFETNNFLFL